MKHPTPPSRGGFRPPAGKAVLGGTKHPTAAVKALGGKGGVSIRDPRPDVDMATFALVSDQQLDMDTDIFFTHVLDLEAQASVVNDLVQFSSFTLTAESVLRAKDQQPSFSLREEGLARLTQQQPSFRLNEESDVPSFRLEQTYPTIMRQEGASTFTNTTMAANIIVTVLSTGTSNAPGSTVLVTGSLLPTPNSLLLLILAFRGGEAQTVVNSVQGFGLTWTTASPSIDLASTSGSLENMVVYRAVMGGSTVSGASCTVRTVDATSQWAYTAMQFNGIDTATPILQSTHTTAGTTVVSLAAFGDARNVALGAWRNFGNAPVTTGAGGFTQDAVVALAGGTPRSQMMVEHTTNTTAVTIASTGTNQVPISGWAAEIKAAP